MATDPRFPLIREVSAEEFKRSMGDMLLPAAKAARRGKSSQQTPSDVSAKRPDVAS
jgi:hypothetical protein